MAELKSLLIDLQKTQVVTRGLMEGIVPSLRRKETLGSPLTRVLRALVELLADRLTYTEESAEPIEFCRDAWASFDLTRKHGLRPGHN